MLVSREEILPLDLFMGNGTREGFGEEELGTEAGLGIETFSGECCSGDCG